jgi:Hepatocellular carcinoma-associated antigen 59
VAETNKIRMEYIESELAKRRQATGSSAMSTSYNAIPGESVHGQNSDRTVQKQPASLGKLHEIDLGPDATMKNIARTEAAARRLDGNDPHLEDEPNGRKPRLGRNGKPWRGRRRRNSEDIKRDKLVEEVLRESKRTFKSSDIAIMSPH